MYIEMKTPAEKCSVNKQKIYNNKIECKQQLNISSTMTKKALLQNSYHFPTKMGSSII
jgi:hypothetical protein